MDAGGELCLGTLCGLTWLWSLSGLILEIACFKLGMRTIISFGGHSFALPPGVAVPNAIQHAFVTASPR